MFNDCKLYKVFEMTTNGLFYVQWIHLVTSCTTQELCFGQKSMIFWPFKSHTSECVVLMYCWRKATASKIKDNNAKCILKATNLFIRAEGRARYRHFLQFMLYVEHKSLWEADATWTQLQHETFHSKRAVFLHQIVCARKNNCVTSSPKNIIQKHGKKASKTI